MRRSSSLSAAGAVVLGMLSSVAWGDVAAPDDLIQITLDTVMRWNINGAGRVYTQNLGTSIFGDMTRMADGRCVAYRTDYGGATPALFEISPATGAAAMLVQSSAAAARVVALAPLRNGKLLGYDSTLRFVSIDPATLNYTLVPVAASNGAASIGTGGMAASPTGEIYAWCSGIKSGVGVFSKLFKIDPDAGLATEIGGYSGLSASQDFQAMAFAPDGRLFGFTDGNGNTPLQARSIYVLDLNTGMPTLVGQRTDLGAVRGAVFMPEPGAVSIVMMGLAALGGRAGRRRKCGCT